MDNEIIGKLEGSIDTLKKYRSITIGKFNVEGLRNGRIRVDGYIYYNTINDIPKESLKSELLIIKTNFLLLANNSPRFKEFVINAGLDYYVVLDYQNAGITICGEIEGQFKLFYK